MIKRAVMIAVLAVVVAALALPLASMRTRAAAPAATRTVATPVAAQPAPASAAPQRAQAEEGGNATLGQPRQAAPADSNADAAFGKISPEVRLALGLSGQRTGARKANKRQRDLTQTPQANEPLIMSSGTAFSAALGTTVGGRDNQFSEVLVLGDFDGREDCSADHAGKVDDFSSVETDIDQSQTRVAISEHTIANGFTENIFYYADSVGNVFVSSSTNLTQAVPTPTVFQFNLTTVLNAFGLLNSDDQVTVTGLAVNPVADLGSFARVNGSYSSFNGLTGEILYISFWDSESGLRLLANGTLVRSGVLAVPVADILSAAPAPPGIISPAGFPVQVGAPFGVAFSVFSNVGGIAVDDDGSVYFHQVDLQQFTGANIVKITGTDQPGIPGVQVGFQDRSLATSGFFTFTTLNPLNGQYGTASGPANQVNTATNYSGTSTTFGNIVALASGPCNVLYAAVARSANSADDAFTQLTEGLFTNPTALGATPSMVISFADCAGGRAACTLPQNPVTGAFLTNTTGGLPVADGFADPAAAGIPLQVPPAASGVPTLTPGVNNFRVFVLGNGPDIRPPAGGTAVVPGTPASVLKVDMQIDYTLHSGITVNEEGTVFVISGGTPAGIGKNPSPMLGEILCFEDKCPADRRADFVDLRATGVLPNPPSSGGNVGDGVSDRFDHIFYQSPLDQITITPAGLAGLTHGFLLYTNRLRTVVGGGFDVLPNGGTQGDDTSNGPIIFEQFDPGHQVAGGDDQVFPFRGDDDDGAGSPVVAGPLSGGFEFLFANPLGDFTQVGAACGTGNGVWNGFFLNSNGNITFGTGDTSNIANVPGFRAGPPKIAPAWADLNPGSRANGFLNTFPVQALGFANINDFKVRWINVPEFGFEACNSSNTFSVSLFDDGTGIDENANQPLNPANPIGNNAVPFDLLEGPTDNRFVREPNTGVIVGCPPRRDGTGMFAFEYCRMDLLGTSSNPVIVGFSVGNQNALNPPGLCAINLSVAALAAETAFGVLPGGETAAVACNCCIGEGTEPAIFELFNTGSGPSIGSGGEITLATPAFDLRFEGNDAALCTAIRQTDLNRGHVCFFGVTCQLPPNPTCLVVLPSVPGQAITAPVVVAPNQPAVGSAAAATPNGAGQKLASPTAGIINALCAVQLNVVGCGFFPNETTTICQGFSSETGVPLQRPGKTVSTAQALACDTNGDGIPDQVTALTSVTPVSCNLVRGTLSPLATAPLTAFGNVCCGGFATLTTTTTFGPGNNNIFNLLPTGGFTRTSTCVLDLGLRAPVVISVTPSDGDCSVLQDLLISGSCFVLPALGPGVGTNVTSVFAVELGNANNTIQAKDFTVLNPNLIDAHFAFGTANAGKTFLIFVSGPNGTSQNLTTLPAGTTCPAGSLGNQQGIQVTFKCRAGSTGGTGGAPGVAVVTACRIDRSDAGTQFLIISGQNFEQGASVTVGSKTPKKVKFQDVAAGSNLFTTIQAKGKFCGGLPGNIVVTNPGKQASAPFSCNVTCQ